MKIKKPTPKQPSLQETELGVLRQQARDLGIAGYGTLRRTELIKAIEDPTTHGSAEAARQKAVDALRTEHEELIEQLWRKLNDDSVPVDGDLGEYRRCTVARLEAQSRGQSDPLTYSIERLRKRLNNEETFKKHCKVVAAKALADEPLWPTSWLEWAPKQSYLIDGVLPRYGVGFLAGQYGAGKSFLAADIAAHIAAREDFAEGPKGRMDWHDHKVELGGSVVYVAAEGASGFHDRINAWMNLHVTAEGRVRNEDVGEQSLDELYWYPRSVNLFEQSEVERFATALRGPKRLIVIDTLAMCSGNADLDAGHSAQQVMSNVRGLAERLKCFVLLVSHLTEKSKNPSHILGASGLEQSADVIWLVKNVDGRLTLTNAKMRDDETQMPIHLSLLKHGPSLIVTHDVELREESDDVDLSVFVEPRTMAELCELLSMPRSTADRVVKRLLERSKIEPGPPRGKAFTYQACALAARHPAARTS